MVKVVGDPKISTKFYIINSKGDIEWLPSYEIALYYTENPNKSEWYNKTLYCTNEDFVYNNEGKLVLASEMNGQTSPATFELLLQDLRKQFDEYIIDKLNNLAKINEYDSYTSAISFINSTIKKYREFATKLSKYRDELYIYVEKYEAELENIEFNGSNTVDIILDDFKNNLPKFKDVESNSEEKSKE